MKDANSKSERAKLGSRLKEAREYLQLSQGEVATELGISRSAISLIEAGDRKVEALELKEFSRIYNRSLDFFAGGEEPSNVPNEVLARATRELNEADLNELAKFAQYLQARPPSSGSQ